MGATRKTSALTFSRQSGIGKRVGHLRRQWASLVGALGCTFLIASASWFGIQFQPTLAFGDSSTISNQLVSKQFATMSQQKVGDFFPKTLANESQGKLVSEAVDSTEYDNFDQAFASYVDEAAKNGFFGDANLHSWVQSDFKNWFRSNEATVLTASNLNGAKSQEFRSLLADSYDLYLFQQYLKSRDHHDFLKKHSTWVNSPAGRYVMNNLDKHADTIITAAVGMLTSAITFGILSGSFRAFTGKLFEALPQLTAALGNRLFGKIGIKTQALANRAIDRLNSPKNTAAANKQKTAAEGALNSLDQIEAEWKFEGMTPEQSIYNRNKLLDLSIQLNQVFSETSQTLNSGRGTTFGFRYDSHRSYAMSNATFHTNFELHRQGFTNALKQINDRFEADSDIKESEMRLALMSKNDPQYPAQKEELKKEKNQLLQEEKQRAAVIKSIIEAKYDAFNVSAHDPTYEQKQTAFTEFAKAQAQKAGLSDEELHEIVYHAGEMRLAQRQTAVTQSEWTYFQYLYPEIRKLNERSDAGKEFYNEYQTIQDWLGYSHYGAAAKEDLQSLADLIRFRIKADVLFPADDYLTKGIYQATEFSKIYTDVTNEATGRSKTDWPQTDKPPKAVDSAISCLKANLLELETQSPAQLKN